MKRRGSCCVVRFAGDADVASNVDRIMLRFRPIAPKPVDLGGGGGTGTGPARESIEKCSGARTKRRGWRRERRRSEKIKVAEAAVDPVTLPLMPETPERKESPARAAGTVLPSCRPAMWWVRVERVTDTCREGLGGCAEEEVRRALEEDGCPAFVSDAVGRVTWTNGAYGRMVGPEAEHGEVWVALVTMGKVPGEAFTCHVRVQKAWPREKGSLTAPCDVWRLADGKFAWRLDLKAALSLGR